RGAETAVGGGAHTEQSLAGGDTSAGAEERTALAGEVLASAEEELDGSCCGVPLPEKAARPADAFTEANAGGNQVIRARTRGPRDVAAGRGGPARRGVTPQA